MSTEKLVVNIIGYPGCGKSSVCAALASDGFELYRPSDTIRAYAKTHEIVLKGREDYIKIHKALNAEDSMAIIRPVLTSAAKRICMDGMRSPLNLDYLEAQGGLRIVTIALDCPIEERFRRVQADDTRRGTHRAPATLEAFRADELPDYENTDRSLVSMIEMMKRADFTIDAMQPPDAVIAQVRGIVQAA